MLINVEKCLPESNHIYVHVASSENRLCDTIEFRVHRINQNRRLRQVSSLENQREAVTTHGPLFLVCVQNK